MNDLVRVEQQLPQSAAEIRAHVNRIQEVMKAVMKEDVHYGVIPGTKKPSLWKPGAEVLCMTFHIAPSFFAEDLSTVDCVRYRVACKGTHQTSGIVMGEGIGEASSNEEKYKWRKASSRKEFEATPEDRRRIKYGYSKEDRREYEIQQVRTEPPDVANTILKMAGKRAHIAMTLNVLAASDIFTQDIEDLPKEMQAEIGDEPQTKKPQVEQPKAKSPKPAETKPPEAEQAPVKQITEGAINTIKKQMQRASLSTTDLHARFGRDEGGKLIEGWTIHLLSMADVNLVLEWIKDPAGT